MLLYAYICIYIIYLYAYWVDAFPDINDVNKHSGSSVFRVFSPHVGVGVQTLAWSDQDLKTGSNCSFIMH